jgi:hypothetical protein
VKRAFLLVAAALLPAGCGGDDDSTDTSATDTVTLPASGAGRVYWLRDGQVWPVARVVEGTNDSGTLVAEAIEQLLRGPTDQEASELALSTAITPDVDDLEISDDAGRVSVTTPSTQSEEALAQIVYTLTQFPDIHSLEIDGRTLTRADFEEQTPLILVESPLAFEEVTSPFQARGTANTFEATFQYEVVDPAGEVVAENFVTATSGTGTRGTFDFTTGDFDVSSDGEGALRVFELSAEDGSRTHEVEIPLRMSTG